MQTPMNMDLATPNLSHTHERLMKDAQYWPTKFRMTRIGKTRVGKKTAGAIKQFVQQKKKKKSLLPLPRAAWLLEGVEQDISKNSWDNTYKYGK